MVSLAFRDFSLPEKLWAGYSLNILVPAHVDVRLPDSGDIGHCALLNTDNFEAHLGRGNVGLRLFNDVTREHVQAIVDRLQGDRPTVTVAQEVLAEVDAVVRRRVQEAPLRALEQPSPAGRRTNTSTLRSSDTSAFESAFKLSVVADAPDVPRGATKQLHGRGQAR